MKKQFVILALAAMPAVLQAQTVIEDFDPIPPSANHPAGSGVFGTWYDVTSDAFANNVVAGTLDGSPAGVFSDGGFTNGNYAIYQSVVPADGTYRVTAKMQITEDGGQLNSIRTYEMGVTVNGAHRGDGTTDLAATQVFGAYVGLDETDNSALPTQVVQTGTFPASTGDNLLIAFSTDTQSGNWELNAGTFGANAKIFVDDITLVDIASVSEWTLY